MKHLKKIFTNRPVADRYDGEKAVNPTMSGNEKSEIRLLVLVSFYVEVNMKIDLERCLEYERPQKKESSR